MRLDSEPQRAASSARVSRTVAGLDGMASDSATSRESSALDRRFWTAMALYAILAALSWFTLSDGVVFVSSKPVELRLVPLIIIGGLALRTVLARQAEKIRREGR
jgi:hypothetical protein